MRCKKNGPICARITSEKYKPFCSKRCAEEDLGKWLTGSYRIPINELEENEEIEKDNQDDKTFIN